MLIKALVILSLILIGGCGIKGPPLPPVPQIQKPLVPVEVPPPDAPARDTFKTIKKKKKTK